MAITMSREQIVACPLTRWEGHPLHCRICNGPLVPGRKWFCSKLCAVFFRASHSKQASREAVHRRDRGRCSQCRRKPKQGVWLEQHHDPPFNGDEVARSTQGCQHHLGRSVLLCNRCHDKRHGQGFKPY